MRGETVVELKALRLQSLSNQFKAMCAMSSNGTRAVS